MAETQEEGRLVYVSADGKKAWWKRSDVPEDIAELIECELDRKPLQLQNHHLPVVFAGGPRSQRVIPVYSTTIYDFTGNVRELPEGMLQKLDEDLLQETWMLTPWHRKFHNMGMSRYEPSPSIPIHIPISPIYQHSCWLNPGLIFFLGSFHQGKHGPRPKNWITFRTRS